MVRVVCEQASPAARVWRHRGRLRVTVALRKVFGLEPGAWMTARSALPKPAAVSPHRDRCDVVLSGTALVRSVRLGLFRGPTALLDKSVILHGTIPPFPITGLGAAAIPAHDAPNELLELPEDVDFSTFQVAPPDQRPTWLEGGDWLVIAGVEPDSQILRTRIPSCTVLATLFDADAPLGRPPALRFVVDGCEIDTDRREAVLTWRGNFPVADGAPLEKLRIEVVLLDSHGEPAQARGASVPERESVDLIRGTIQLSDAVSLGLAARSAVPFATPSPRAPGVGPRPESLTGLVQELRAKEVVVRTKDDPLDGTVEAPLPPIAPAGFSAPERDPLDGTMEAPLPVSGTIPLTDAVSLGSAARAAMPFATPGPRAPGVGPRSESLAGLVQELRSKEAVVRTKDDPLDGTMEAPLPRIAPAGFSAPERDPLDGTVEAPLPSRGTARPTMPFVAGPSELATPRESQLRHVERGGDSPKGTVEFDLRSLSGVLDMPAIPFVRPGNEPRGKAKRRVGAALIVTDVEALLALARQPGRLVGATLRGIVAPGLDLSGVDLSETRWIGTSFVGGRFDRARLVGADIRGASLRDASLSDAHLGGANVDGVDLSRATLSRVRLLDARLSGVNLCDADAEGVDFGVCRRVERLRLEGARLRGARFARAKLEGVDLRGASLEGSSFEACLLDAASCAGVDFSGSCPRDTSFREADLEGARLEGVDAFQIGLRGAKLGQARLAGLAAQGADARAAVFDRADLSHADFRGGTFEGASLKHVLAKNARFDRGRFERANLSQASFERATLRYADLSHARLDEAIFLDADLSFTNLHRASTSGASFVGATLAGVRSTNPERSRAEDFPVRSSNP